MTDTQTDTWGKTREAFGSHQAAFFAEKSFICNFVEENTVLVPI